MIISAPATGADATFVIGVGPSLSALNGIAAAGGTTSAFLVDTSANVNQQFLDAMNAIRNSASKPPNSLTAPSSDRRPTHSFAWSSSS